MFHARWWDYSHYKFNINGRICLLNSVLFGVLGVVVIHFVYPYMLQFLNWIGNTVIRVSYDVISVALSVDIILTVRKLVDFGATMEKIKTFGDSLRDHYGNEAWFRGGSFSEMLASVKEHAAKERIAQDFAVGKEKISQNILDKIEKFQTVRNKAAESFMAHFPTMKSIQYKDALEHLKERVKDKVKTRLKK